MASLKNEVGMQAPDCPDGRKSSCMDDMKLILVLCSC